MAFPAGRGGGLAITLGRAGEREPGHERHEGGKDSAPSSRTGVADALGA